VAGLPLYRAVPATPHPRGWRVPLWCALRFAFFHSPLNVLHMPKRTSSSSESPPLAPRVLELEVRAGQLDAILQRIDDRISEVCARLEELPKVHQLALEAVAQAQDAFSTCQPLEARINHLTLAVAEGIQHVDRAERRIAGTVARARKLLAESGVESPGLEAEAYELRLLDGDSGKEPRVLQVPTNVEPPAEADPLVERLRAIGLSR